MIRLLSLSRIPKLQNETSLSLGSPFWYGDEIDIDLMMQILHYAEQMIEKPSGSLNNGPYSLVPRGGIPNLHFHYEINPAKYQ